MSLPARRYRYKRGLCCRPVSVRLSVRQVVGLYPHGEYIVKLLVPPSNTTTLGFFFNRRRRYPILKEPLQRERKGAGKYWRFWTEITVYLRNGAI